MCLTTPSSRTSSGRTTESEVIARRARHEASLKRQALRQIDKKAGERVWVDDYPRARSARTKSTRSIAGVPEPDASPFRRGLEYLCDNFLPAFLTPKKKRDAVGTIARKRRAPSRLVLQDDTSPRVSTEITETVCAGPSSSEKSMHLPLTEENLLAHTGSLACSAEEANMDKDEPCSESSLSSAETPTPARHHEPVGVAAGVDDDKDGMDVDDCQSAQGLYERITRWQATGNFEPPLEQAELPNPFAEMEIEWSSNREAEHEILIVRFHAEHALYQLLASGEELSSGLETMAQNEAFLYVEHLEVKFRERYGRQPIRGPAHFQSYTLNAGRNSLPETYRIIGALQSPERFVVHFARYELKWISVNKRVHIPLTFDTIPWPMFFRPQQPEDITMSRVQDFIRLTKFRYNCDFLFKSTEELKEAARYELHHRWTADVFAEVVLPRISDEWQAVIVLNCAHIVEEALQQLVSA